MAAIAETSIEEILIALETDHGYPMLTGSMASGPTNDEIEAVCAFGNIAIDYAKRGRFVKTVSNIRRLGNNLAEAWSAYLSDKGIVLEDEISYEGLDIIHNNDDSLLSFQQNAAQVREALASQNIPLDTKIEFFIDTVEREL